MTGGGAPGGPGIIKGIKQDSNIELVVGDSNSEATGRYLNDKFEQILNANETDYIEDLLRICIKHEINIILPLVTNELFVLSKNKKYFEDRGIKIIVSEYDSLKIANDKSALYNHLKANNISTPNFKVAKTFDEVLYAFEQLGYPENPICIKPSVSNGSRGVRIVDSSIDEFELLFKHKPNSLYITFDKLKEVLEGKQIPELLISEVLPGEEFTIDTIVSKGKAEIILPRKRSRMNGGISVAGSFEENKEIINYCKEIIDSLNLDGPIGLQVKQSESGKYKILEINPRIQGTSIAALGLGINLPLLSIYNALGYEIKMPAINWNVNFIRYYNEVFY